MALRVEDIPVYHYETLTHPPSFEDHITELTTPVNQGLCGSCWAISTSQCLRDRMLSINKNVPELSFQYIIDCAKNCVTYQGREGCALDCNGGFLSTSYIFLQRTGTVREAFYPNRHDDESGMDHIEGVKGIAGGCPDVVPEDEPVFKCDTFYNLHIYPDMFGITNARIPPRIRSKADLKRNADNIAEEIFRNGSVSVCFNLYSDFKDFWLHPNSKDMIYEIGWQLPASVRRTIPAVGSVNWVSPASGVYGIYFKTGHSVSIVGFGTAETTEGPVQYWVCRNSWGNPANTLHNGYFRIRRGINCSAIEADVSACTVSKLPDSIMVQPLYPAGAISINNSESKPSILLIMALVVLFIVVIIYFSQPSTDYLEFSTYNLAPRLQDPYWR